MAVISTTGVVGTTSMLHALRQATAEAHTTLDRRLDFADLTVARYTTFLRASYSVLSALEPRIACWFGVPADGMCRVGALRSDLAALDSNSVPTMPIPPIASLAEAMGAAYVVEGSALGGMVIARMLPPELPRRYLTLRGERTGPAWRDVVAKIEAWAHGTSPSARATACEAARATFAAYTHAFEAMGALRGE